MAEQSIHTNKTIFTKWNFLKQQFDSSYHTKGVRKYHLSATIGTFVTKGKRAWWDKLLLLKTKMLVELFGFYKMFLKSWYLHLKTKKKLCFFQVFLDCLFFSWNFYQSFDNVMP